MTQFLTEIGNYPIQAGVPSNWTFEVGHADPTIVADFSEYSDRSFTTTTVYSATDYTWDTPGVQTNEEALCLFKFTGTATNGNSYDVLSVRHQGGSLYCYGLSLTANSSSGGATAKINRYYSGGTSQLASASFTWVKDVWYWARLRANGTTLTARIWAKGTAEPGTWPLSGTSSTFANGKIGIPFTSNALKLRIAVLGGASAGDTAPGAVAELLAIANIAASSSVLAKPGKISILGFNEDDIVKFGLASQLRARFTAQNLSLSATMGAQVGLNVHERIPFRYFEEIYFPADLAVIVDSHVIRRQLRAYVGDRYHRRYAKDYADAFDGLLPTGLAWPRDPTSVLQKVVSGLAGIWGDTVEMLAWLLLVRESDPRSTVMLLPDWERAWGLPDKCLAEPLTIHDRQVALVNKMTLLGGQSRAFFTSLSNLVGYQIEIREFAPFMVGISQCGDTKALYDKKYWRWEIGRPEMRFYWTVRLGSLRLTWFRASNSQAGIDYHLEFGLATDVECLLRRWKPAHTEIVYNYSSPLIGLDFSQGYDSEYMLLNFP